MPSSSDHRKKVLVIDDSPTVLHWIRAQLTAAGYDVIVHAQAIGTGAAVVREQPDLVIVDVQMPLLEGDELVASIRRCAVGKQIQIVLHSSLPLPELQRRASAAGADGAIPKSSDAAGFLRRVAGYLLQARRRAGRRETA